MKVYKKAVAAKHISQIYPKTAEVLASSPLKDDAYHWSIKHAANVLVGHGFAHAIYQHQKANGGTLWIENQTAIKVALAVEVSPL
jgi:hypothetical protein